MMPYARAVDGVRLYYEVAGPRHSPPILMIQGLGTDRRAWALQQAGIARRFRCIVFDNRGVGRSDKPAGPYELLGMAEDALRVLAEAGYQQAHVMGISMGGVIAQILAVRHARQVRSLILVATACRHHRWRRELLEQWAATARHQGMGALTNRSLRWLIGPRARRRLYLPAQLFGSLLVGVPPHAFASQVAAILNLDEAVHDELAKVGVPTLIAVGSQDILTPLGDSEELAERIPGSELVVFHGAAHGLPLEKPGAFNRMVLEFLDEVENRRAPGRRKGANPSAVVGVADASRTRVVSSVSPEHPRLSPK